MTPFDMEGRGTSNGGWALRFFPRDPRLGILAYLLLIAAAFIVRRPEGMACLLFYVVLLHLLSGATPKAIWNRSKKILLFAVLALLLNAALVKGEPLITMGARQLVSKEGLARGIYFFMQILMLYLSTVLFIALTPQEALARGISALIRPVSSKLAKRMALYAFLSIGFLPLFFEEFERISILQRFRGGGLEGGLLQKMRGARLLVVPLFLSAIHRSGQLAMVVELRGLRDAVGELVSLRRPDLKDYVFICITLIVLVFCSAAFSAG